jgi:hypothetical protein
MYDSKRSKALSRGIWLAATALIVPYISMKETIIALFSFSYKTVQKSTQ